MNNHKNFSFNKRSLTATFCLIVFCTALILGSILFANVKGVSASEKTINLITIQPWYNENSTIEDSLIELPDGIPNDAELITGGARLIAKEFSNCVYTKENAIKNEPTTLETIKKLGKNQIIIWQGHGSWISEEVHSALWTKNDFDEDKYENDPVYRDDCDNDRIVRADWFYEAITAKYIEKYCGDLSGSFIYLGQCQGGYDSGLAEAFLKKGASAVIANTDTIRTRYGDVMQYTTAKYLAQINPSTDNYYTLQEALNMAKEKYGKDDSVYPAGLGAEPTIFGNKNYRISDALYTPDFPIFSIAIFGAIFLGVTAVSVVYIIKRKK